MGTTQKEKSDREKELKCVTFDETVLDGLIHDGFPEEKDRAQHNEMTELYQHNLQTILSTKNMPDTPIDPITYSKKVINVIKEFKSDNSEAAKGIDEIFIDMCKLFNHCIASQNNSSYVKSLVYPAQTGIGKSVGLKNYVSMLANESSLIIVATVEEAIRYCEDINELSNDKDYARCYYSLSSNKDDNSLRVKNTDLKNYRCIVITHNKFKLVNQSVDIDLYRLYKGKQRDLIVIDEKLSFYEQYKVTYKEIDELINKVEQSIKASQKIKSIENHEKCLEFIKELKLYLTSHEEHIVTNKYAINILDDKDYDLSVVLDKDKIISLSNVAKNDSDAIRSKKVQEATAKYFESLGIEFQLGEKPVTMITRNELRKYFSEKNFDINKMFELLKNILDTRVDELFDEIKLLGNLSNSKFKESTKENLLKPIDNLSLILNDDFVLYISNYEKSIFRVNNISHKLGNNVILDATANINEFYTVANRLFGQIGLVPAKQIRKYSNLNIHKATGFNQSRTALYKKKTAKEIKSNAETYLSYAYSELTHTNDKMLIISHKDFKDYLEPLSTDDRIVFTHWGNHVGKNDWNDCNKVMIIGWNYINPIGHLSNIYNAAIDIDLVTYRIDAKTIKQFEITQLADDLVQGVMRSRARIIDQTDGNCKPTDIYLFSKQDSEDDKLVIELFESQFPESNITKWTPTGKSLPNKKTKRELNADKVIELLKSKESTHQTYLSNDVATELKINKTTFHHLMDLDYMKEQLKKNNFLLQKKDQKSYHFILN